MVKTIYLRLVSVIDHLPYFHPSKTKDLPPYSPKTGEAEAAYMGICPSQKLEKKSAVELGLPQFTSNMLGWRRSISADSAARL